MVGSVLGWNLIAWQPYQHADSSYIISIDNLRDLNISGAYKCNKQLVIALNPLPHSGSQTTEEAACDKCKRKLLDPNANRYCSIACKVQAFLRKETGLEPPCLSLQSPTLERRPKLRRPKRPRKGVPHRAPLS
ncbi:hypothetical protein U1Q18_039780 [Sarracenia purpurea var. burkii]